VCARGVLILFVKQHDLIAVFGFTFQLITRLKRKQQEH